MDLPLRNIARTAALAAGVLLGMQGAALAQQWIGPLVAAYDDEEHDCRLEVSGNGRFYRLTAFGLEPGEAARLTVFNRDMKPIERAVRADGTGTWAEFYLPALPRYRGGVVQASVVGAHCDLGVSFPWQRPSANIDPTPSRPASHFAED